MILKLKVTPFLNSPRLTFRAFEESDASNLLNIINDRSISYTTAAIPYPASHEYVKNWINGLKNQFIYQSVLTFAIILNDTAELIGTISLSILPDYDQADLGYWINKRYWNQGYATEASKRLIDYAFRDLELNSITANHLERNPASGKVMKKLGMQFLYKHPHGIRKWGVYENLDHYILFAKDYYSQLK